MSDICLLILTGSAALFVIGWAAGRWTCDLFRTLNRERYLRKFK